jgi:hypothetical protein
MRHAGALDECERYAAMTPEERLAIFEEVCELARTILEEHPERARILAEDEPMPPAAEAAWRRLVRQARDGRSAR